MKFTCTVDIDAPLDQVVELFKDTENLKAWQDGIQSFEHLSGNANEAGAKSKIVFQQGKQRIELIETIQVMDLPREKTALYEHTHMVNTMKSSFADLGSNKTRFTAEIHYTKFIGLMPKLMAWLMPGLFKKQTQKWLDQFKAFSENPEGAVA